MNWQVHSSILRPVHESARISDMTRNDLIADKVKWLALNLEIMRLNPAGMET